MKRHGNHEDLLGQVFDRWTVIADAGRDSHSRGRWLCRCVCGKEKTIHARHLKAGRSRSCRCVQKKDGTPVRNLMCQYKNGAKHRGYSFELDEETFTRLTSAPCYYCGIPPSTIQKAAAGRTYVYNGVDRINNDLGYTLENSRTCCATCNRMKHTHSVKEFLEHIQRIVAFCPDLKKSSI
jgi:hypothetical protein